MNYRSRAVFLTIITFSVMRAQDAGIGATTYPVSGVVVNRATGQPIKNARLTLRTASNVAETMHAVTNDDGAFAFPPVPAGKYSLTAHRNGFADQAYGQRRLVDGLGTAIITGPNLHMEHLVFRMIPPAAIGGRVTDDQGDPVAGAILQLYRFAIVSGRRRVTGPSYTYSNDQGEFRFPKLGAGTYYLAGSAHPWYQNEILAQHENENLDQLRLPGTSDTALDRKGYALTYYPNTTDPHAAGPIVVKSGQEATADIVLPTIAGSEITIGLGGVPEPSQVHLTSDGPGGARVYWLTSYPSGEKIVFSGVPPGQYQVVANSKSNVFSYTGGQDIDVGSSDMEVQLTASALSSVSGSLRTRGGESASFSGSIVTLVSEDLLYRATTTVKADGRFTLPPIVPDRYRIWVRGSTESYIESITTDGAAVSNGVVDLKGGGKVQLTIVGSQRPAQLKGFLEKDGQPMPDAFLVLVPSKDTEDLSYYRAFQTDADGSFDFHGVHPGQYVLIALEDGSNLEYANPVAIAPLRKQGKAIEFAPGDVQEMKLTFPQLLPVNPQR